MPHVHYIFLPDSPASIRYNEQWSWTHIATAHQYSGYYTAKITSASRSSFAGAGKCRCFPEIGSDRAL